MEIKKVRKLGTVLAGFIGECTFDFHLFVLTNCHFSQDGLVKMDCTARLVKMDCEARFVKLDLCAELVSRTFEAAHQREFTYNIR